MPDHAPDVGEAVGFGALGIYALAYGCSPDVQSSCMHLGGYELGDCLRPGRLQDNWRGIDVVAVAVGHVQLHAVALVGVDVRISVAVHDFVADASRPRRRLLGLIIVRGLHALPLLPLEIDELGVNICAV